MVRTMRPAGMVTFASKFPCAARKKRTFPRAFVAARRERSTLAACISSHAPVALDGVACVSSRSSRL